MSFNELGLSDRVLKAVEGAGYTTPTPIQAQAIPHVMQRRDVLGIAQTGTGKTAAFTLPMLSRLESGRARARMPRTLILEPTRELAAQVEDSFVKYGVNHKLNVALLIGGVSFGDQDAKITRGVDVLIATPGRLLDHIERGKLLLSGIEILVIDEADRMLDMGFIPDIERICKMVPFTRQTLFFSATMPPEITRLSEAFLHNPVRVEVSRPASTVATTTQRLVASGAKDYEKRDLLRNLIKNADGLKNAIIFCNRKKEVGVLHRSLVKYSLQAVALHGDMDQHSRLAALDSFKNGAMDLLIASDVAARGLDIPDVSHVFNYDTPHHAEDYVHRIGRTGRAGRHGTAITLVTPGDDKNLAAIERLIGQKIEWMGAPAAALTPTGGEREDGRGVRRPRRDASERAGESRGRGRASGRNSSERNGDPERPAQADGQGRTRERAAQAEGQGRTRERAAQAEGQGRTRAAPPARRREPASTPQRPPVAAVQQPRAPRYAEETENRRPSERDPGDRSVQGMGDHVPNFLLRSTRRGG